MLAFRGEIIATDGDMVSLTDMWRAAGADDSKRPSDWRALPATKAFVEFIAESIAGKSGSELFRVVRSGGDVATLAHWQVGMAFAKYLSAEFHAWCNTVVRGHMSGQQVALEPSREALRLRAMELRFQREDLRDARALRKMQVNALQRVATSLALAGRAEVATVMELKAAEIAVGERFDHLLPSAVEHHDWKSPTQIAEAHAITPNAVGRLISAIPELAQRGDIPGMCRPVVNKAPGCTREVVSFIYSPAAVARIESQMREPG